MKRVRRAVPLAVGLLTVLAVAASALGGTMLPGLPAPPSVGAAPTALPPPAGTTERVSVGADGRQGDSASGGVTALLASANGDQSISADGRWVAFASTATNLIPGTTNPAGGIFVRDRESGTTIAVPWIGGADVPTGVRAAEPTISGDGAVVAFTAVVTPNADAGGLSVRAVTPFVLAWDRQTNLTEVVSIGPDGRPTPGIQPSISADGRYIAYTRWFIDTTPPVLSNLTTDGFPSGGEFFVFGPSAPCTPHSATISVTATDPDDDVAAVTLFVQPNGGSVTSQAMSSAGSNVWRATLAAQDAWATGRITYWVQGTDSHGNVSSALNSASPFLLSKGDCIL